MAKKLKYPYAEWKEQQQEEMEEMAKSRSPSPEIHVDDMPEVKQEVVEDKVKVEPMPGLRGRWCFMSHDAFYSQNTKFLKSVEKNLDIFSTTILDVSLSACVFLYVFFS